MAKEVIPTQGLQSVARRYDRHLLKRLFLKKEAGPLPEWIKRADSFEGLAEMMKNPDVKATFFQYENAQALEILRAALGVKEHYNIFDQGIRMLPYRLHGANNPTPVEKLLERPIKGTREESEYVLEHKKVLDAAYESLEEMSRSLLKGLPGFSLNSAMLRTRTLTTGTIHTDMNGLNPEKYIVVIWNIFGPSPVYFADKQGSGEIHLPEHVIIMQRCGDENGAWHASPEHSKKLHKRQERMSVVFFFEKTS